MRVTEAAAVVVRGVVVQAMRSRAAPSRLTTCVAGTRLRVWHQAGPQWAAATHRAARASASCGTRILSHRLPTGSTTGRMRTLWPAPLTRNCHTSALTQQRTAVQSRSGQPTHAWMTSLSYGKGENRQRRDQAGEWVRVIAGMAKDYQAGGMEARDRWCKRVIGGASEW
jgi:uncharacterized protein RhaS with RHS repeats